ncbi:hypothetical protein B0H14DRAFT_3493071 [Mycena olivaceomarginata]|nr:hypothetical protein B0H14DRAFT_3493071 [Mycena olivaceomarginata]
MKAFIITAQGISAAVVDNHPIPRPDFSIRDPRARLTRRPKPDRLVPPVRRHPDYHDARGARHRPGQRVAGFVMDGALDLTRGAFAEYLVSDATTVAAVPDNVTDEAAASLGVGFATAMMGLFLRLGLPEPLSALEGTEQPVVLINGASTSVGLYAVQLARLAGIRVVATASPRMHALVRELGADVVLMKLKELNLSSCRSEPQQNLSPTELKFCPACGSPVYGRTPAFGA